MWVVEWLHRRVIPGEGKRQAEDRLGRWYFWRVLGRLAFAQDHLLRNLQDWSIPICHGLVLSWYGRLAFRNKKIICKPATGSMTPKISKSWKLEILFAHDQSEQVEALILMIFVRWCEFHFVAAFHRWIHATCRVVTPKSNTGRGQTWCEALSFAQALSEIRGSTTDLYS